MKNAKVTDCEKAYFHILLMSRLTFSMNPKDFYAEKEGHNMGVLLFYRRVLLLKRYWPAYGQLWHLAASKRK